MVAELPPISNWFVYIYRVIMKWLSFLLFGIGTLVLVLLIFPVMCLFLHPKERFQKHARPLVSCIMRLFTSIMYGMGIVEVDADDLKVYRGLVSKIVVANHPSLLDVVILFSLIPNADCIVNGNLSHNIIWGVIQRLYIPNSLNFEKLSQVCIQSLSQGNCIIIFPEGTRTPRSGEMSLKKGAARLALQSGCAIVPIHIGGTDKYGLGKHDPWWGFNPVDKYLYRIRMQGALAPQKYADLPASIAVKHLTTDIKEILLHPLHC